MANDIVQTIAEARVDARSLSDFVFKPAGFKVTRRLAPTIDTLQFYIDRFNSLNGDFSSSVSVALSSLNSYVAEADGKVAYIETTVQDAINNTAVEGGVLADTFVTATANGAGSVARTQRDVNSDVVSVKGFVNVEQADLSAAFLAAQADNAEILIPTGFYDINSDLTVTSKLTFQKGAVLNIANGVTVDFTTGEVSAGNYRIFSDTGTVTGLSSATPEWFGAKQDITHDSTVAFNKCLELGDLVIKGMYALAGVVVPSNRVVKSDGSAVVHLYSNTQPAFSLSGVDNVAIRGIDITSSRALAARGSQGCISIFDGSTNITIDSCLLEKAGAGVHFTDTVNSNENITIKNCTIRNNRLGGVSGRAENILLEGNKIYDNGYFAGGKTHNVYVTGNNCKIYYNDIGEVNEDMSTPSVYIKGYKAGGFAGVNNCKIIGNTIAGGMSITQSTDDAADTRNDTINPLVYGNTFTGDKYGNAFFEIVNPVAALVTKNTFVDIARCGFLTNSTKTTEPLSGMFVNNTLQRSSIFSGGLGNRDEASGYVYQDNSISLVDFAFIRHATAGARFYGTLRNNSTVLVGAAYSNSVVDDSSASRLLTDENSAQAIGANFVPNHIRSATLAYNYSLGSSAYFQIDTTGVVAEVPTNMPIGSVITYNISNVLTSTQDVTFPIAAGFYSEDTGVDIAVSIPRAETRILRFKKVNATSLVRF